MSKSNVFFELKNNPTNDVTVRSTSPLHRKNTATLLQALTVSDNRSWPHRYWHSQYHTTDHCHTGKDTHSITVYISILRP